MIDWPRHGENHLFAVPAPQLFINGQSTRGPFPAFPPSDLDQYDCPLRTDLDRSARPLFSIAGDGPFRWLPPAGINAEVCAHIKADGSVSRTRMLVGVETPAIDARILRTIRSLRFEPAIRDHQPVAAWHRLIVNRQYGQTVETPEPSLVY